MTNPRGDTLLTVAAYSGQEAAVEVILKQSKVEIDVRNKMGLTALTAAAFQGHLPIAQKLVKAGSDVNIANGSGQTALMFAALAGRLALVDFLLESNTNVRAADATGKTALILAEQQGAEDVVKRLKAALAPR